MATGSNSNSQKDLRESITGKTKMTGHGLSFLDNMVRVVEQEHKHDSVKKELGNR